MADSKDVVAKKNQLVGKIRIAGAGLPEGDRVGGRTRPTPLQWIGYTAGRPLPASMQDWVRNDLTGSWRVPRHLVRGMIPFVPIFVVFMFFPGPLYLRLMMVLLGLLLALFYSAAYMAQNRSRRLEQHGLPGDLENPKQVRREADDRAAYERIHGRS
jgi:hypothetical protein